jgi:hypothetical protein
MSKKMDAIMGPRPMSSDPQPAERIKLQGLALDDMVRRPLSWFRHNPDNEVFTALKTASYWQALERDIREAGAILAPLIAMPDGLLIEGESRLTIARKLSSEGLLDFDLLPVRIIKGELSADDQRKRLYLGNLSRFEIDEDTRLTLYAKVWPNYYLAEPSKGGRPTENGDTVSLFPPTAKEIAEATGKSPRQVKRDRAVVQTAKRMASMAGKREPGAEDIKKAREKENAQRRAKATLTTPLQERPRTRAVIVELSFSDADEVIAALQTGKPSDRRKKIIDKIKKAAASVTHNPKR